MQSNRNPVQGGSGAAAVAPKAAVQHVLTHCKTTSEFCSTLAKLFGVRLSEVAVMRLENGLLKFVLPEELKTAGAIPVSSSSAIAARTASTKKAEVFNNFSKVQHARVFEAVKLICPEDSEKHEHSQIQKLMSAPVLDGQRKVLGVIQICRKGFDVGSAGPDFTASDMEQLGMAATAVTELGILTLDN